LEYLLVFLFESELESQILQELGLGYQSQ
jgi:hypothetical protein